MKHLSAAAGLALLGAFVMRQWFLGGLLPGGDFPGYAAAVEQVAGWLPRLPDWCAECFGGASVLDAPLKEILAFPLAALFGPVLGTKLAEKLGVGIGDTVDIEVLEGRRPVLSVPVAELFETYIGMPAYMDLDTLNRLMLDRPTLEYANLLVDEQHQAALYKELKNIPEVSAVMIKRAASPSSMPSISISSSTACSARSSSDTMPFAARL